jgi:hypothetical protein
MGQRVSGCAQEVQPPAGTHHREPVAQLEARRGVRDDNDGAALAGEPGEQLHRLRLQPRIQTGGRLVQEQHARPPQELDGQPGALALPARQVADADVGPVCQVELRQRPVDEAIDLIAVEVGREPQASGVTQRLARRQLRVDDLVLRQIADVRQPRRDRVAVQRDGSGVGFDGPGQRPDERRLARSAPPDHAQQLAGAHR